MSQFKKVFVTGTNRGLGHSLIKFLHKNHPELQLHISSRTPSSEFSQKWEAEAPGHNFHTYQMDLNNHQQIADNARKLKASNIAFNYIVANAAVGVDHGVRIPSVDVAKNTLITNVTSTIDFIKHFLPLLSEDGRVVIVSAMMGALKGHSQQFQTRMNNPAITEEEIIQIVNEYIASAERKDMGSFHKSAYKTSKTLINTWARFILPTYLKKNQTAICLHPGWCKTDLGGKSAPLTPQEGALKIFKGMELKEVDHTRFYNEKYCNYDTCQ